jgi:aryl-alcohol dehydrogenase-like predicted oxidoreductase
MDASSLRKLGSSDIMVSSVAMGCWPIAGVTSLEVTREHSLETLHAALDAGINFFDTAYAYGCEGESEQLIGEVTAARRNEVVIATKGGLHRNGKLQEHDARPETLRRQCDESLRRLKTDHVELYYLHAPDPAVPVCDSAGAIRDLIVSGKVMTAGASNLSIPQLEEFHRICPLSAVQPHYNMLQRDIESDILPWCRERGISVCVYWPLMKGFLAGRLPRNHQFPEADGRRKYPMFQGEEWQKNQDFLEDLKLIACEAGLEVSQLVIAWTIQQPGITAALCGAKRKWQITETARGMQAVLTAQTLQQIDAALSRRGKTCSRSAV